MVIKRILIIMTVISFCACNSGKPEVDGWVTPSNTASAMAIDDNTIVIKNARSANLFFKGVHIVVVYEDGVQPVYPTND
jgi:hypothetical protein